MKRSMILPHTSQALLRAGYSPQQLQQAASRAFTNAQTATTGDIQQFWYAFMGAHRALYRGGTMQEAA